MENKKKQHQKLAPLCSIIPGGGQFYNGQRLKGVLYFVLVTAYVLATFQTVIYGNKGGGGYLGYLRWEPKRGRTIPCFSWWREPIPCFWQRWAL